MKHFILLIVLTFPHIVDAAPRSATASEDQIACLQVAASSPGTRSGDSSDTDDKSDKKRDLILSALSVVINATNMAINRKDEDKSVVKQEAQKMLDNIFTFVSVITKRNAKLDPEIKELVAELLTVYGRLKQSLQISGHHR